MNLSKTMRVTGRIGLALVSLSLLTALPAQPPANPNPMEFRTMIADTAKGNETAEAAKRWFGEADLKKGANPKTSDLTVAWAVDVAETSAPPKVVSEDGKFSLPLTRLGSSTIYAAVTTLPEGEALRWAYEVNGQRLGDWRQLEVYTTPPELKADPSVPKGEVIQMPEWKSKVYENTVRDWWIYVPSQYKADKPAAVMVFQDGAGVRGYMATLFDNMIAKGEIPVTIGIFINPGTRVDPTSGNRSSNRSIEYDTLSNRYVTYLVDEILPEVSKKYSLRSDPAGRVIAGVSSGGICAFTAAWERPDQFSKVVSGVGSFVNLQGGSTGIGGGHNYPTLIRQSRGKAKPIHVYLSDGENDLDNPFGNWPLANQQMAKALAFSGYDYKFVYGKGFHGGAYFRVLMPDALRWVWRDEVKR